MSYDKYLVNRCLETLRIKAKDKRLKLLYEWTKTKRLTCAEFSALVTEVVCENDEV